MALALYRKYRPRTFAEVIGQEHVTEPLSQALRSGRLNHAYLFSGPRGCGKTSSARILARSLNCEQGPTPEPCGVCGSCRSLTNDGTGSLDVIEIDAASHGGVDDARELREKAFFAPASSRFKIYVIDEAHMVSSQGFNALLKLVEEPPDYVKFIFATTEPDKVLGTIRSRTHHYPFRLIPPPVLRPYLQQLCESEGMTVEPSVLPLVVRAGGGSARDSLSILDQLIAGSGPEGVTYARAVGLLGVTDAALIDEMCEAIAGGDGAAAYATIDRVAEAGHEPRRFASDLLERFRDLIILQQVPDAVPKGLIDGPADQLEVMAGQAGVLGPATLSRCADILHNGLVEMRGTTAPRLLLELVTARMLLPAADDSSAALLQRLERLERGVTAVPPASGPAVAANPSAVRGEHPTTDDLRDPAAEAGGVVPADGTAPGGAGGGGKAAAMAAARAALSKSSGPAVRQPPPVAPVSPAALAASVAPISPAAPVSSVAPVSPAAPAPQSTAVPVPSSSAPDAPARAADPGVPEPDWNDVAAGKPEPVESAYDEEPPWDQDEPPAEPPSPPVVSPFERVLAAWNELGRNNQRVNAAQEAGVALGNVDGRTVVLTAPKPNLVARMRNLTDLIAEEFGTALTGSWIVRCEVGEAPGPARGAGNVRGPEATTRGAQSGNASRAYATAPELNSAPEHNTGRSEARPSRPAPRDPVTDAEDDWPEPARPPVVSPDSGVVDTGWPEPARPPAAPPDARDAVLNRSDPALLVAASLDAEDPVPGRAEPMGRPSASDARDVGRARPSAASPGTGHSTDSGGGAGSAWPEPAPLGGRVNPAATPPGPGAAGSSDDEPAVRSDGAGTSPDSPVGGAAVSVGPPGAGAAPARSAATAVAATAGGASGAPAPPGGPAVPARSAAMEAARAAARGGVQPTGGGAAVARAALANARGGPAGAAASSTWADGSPIEEAPYDPDYDGPPPVGAVLEGFDPGDEPLDEVIDEKTARQSSEQQAMQLLRDAFGAEKIAEL